jgi:hypothetical protein
MPAYVDGVFVRKLEPSVIGVENSGSGFRVVSAGTAVNDQLDFVAGLSQAATRYKIKTSERICKKIRGRRVLFFRGSSPALVGGNPHGSL